MALLADDRPIGGHGYGPWVVSMFLRLVLVDNVSLRAAPRAMETMSESLGLRLPVPSWTTGRLWLLRLGHAMLTTPLEHGSDWVWLIDHSVQIGRQKCLVILGVRLRDLPRQSLQHRDMHLVALVLSEDWTCPDVCQTLEDAVARTGVPRVIVDDHGADLNGGVKLFQQRHPETVEIYDIKHKAACLLKHRMGNDPVWAEFNGHVGRTRSAVQQTELGFMVPPSPRPKARFMNLGPLLRWATQMLAILRDPPEAVTRHATVGRLREKFGWIESFTDDVTRWSQWQQVIELAVPLINCKGLYHGAANSLQKQLSQLDALDDSAKNLATELVEFVRSQESQAKRGERITGSTEILESSFGKFKQLEKQHSRGGFTHLLLGFGAMLCDVATDVVEKALEHSRTADVRRWLAQMMGNTLSSQRRLAFASVTEDG